MLEPHQRSAFRLGDVVSGEPQLYCGYAARPLMPRTIVLVTSLCRRMAAAAQNLFRRARPRRDATIAALPPRSTAPARHRISDTERRAA